MKSLKTVATRVVTDIRQWIDLFCKRYWLAGVWSTKSGVVGSGGKDIGDVVDSLLRVMTYVVFYVKIAFIIAQKEII